MRGLQFAQARIPHAGGRLRRDPVDERPLDAGVEQQLAHQVGALDAREGLAMKAELAARLEVAVLSGDEGDRAGRETTGADIGREVALLQQLHELERLADAAADARQMHDLEIRRGRGERARLEREAVLEAAGDLELGALAHHAQRVGGNLGIALVGHAPGGLDLRDADLAEADGDQHDDRQDRKLRQPRAEPAPSAVEPVLARAHRRPPYADGLDEQDGDRDRPRAEDRERDDLRIVGLAIDQDRQPQDRRDAEAVEREADQPERNRQRIAAAPEAEERVAGLRGGKRGYEPQDGPENVRRRPRAQAK